MDSEIIAAAAIPGVPAFHKTASLEKLRSNNKK